MYEWAPEGWLGVSAWGGRYMRPTPDRVGRYWCMGTRDSPGWPSLGEGAAGDSRADAAKHSGRPSPASGYLLCWAQEALGQGSGMAQAASPFVFRFLPGPCGQ